MKSVQRCAMVISPGRAAGHPPRRLATLAHGWTLTNGRIGENGSPPALPTIERILASVRISVSEAWGRILANARQSMVFHDHGAPSSSILCV